MHVTTATRRLCIRHEIVHDGCKVGCIIFRTTKSVELALGRRRHTLGVGVVATVFHGDVPAVAILQRGSVECLAPGGDVSLRTARVNLGAIKTVPNCSLGVLHVSSFIGRPIAATVVAIPPLIAPGKQAGDCPAKNSTCQGGPTRPETGEERGGGNGWATRTEWSANSSS